MFSMSPLFLAALFVVTVAVMSLAFEGGLRFGRWRRRQPDPEPELLVRMLVASTLGLLSFILGFTFGLASSHYDARSQSVFDEAVAIGTAYHRADFLPDAERTKMRHLLREYVDLRVNVGRLENAGHAIESLKHSQKNLWAEAVALGKRDLGPSVTPLIQSLTEVIDVHGERVVAGFQSRIPLPAWLILYGITVLSVGAAGYLAGLAGTRRSYSALAYSVVFAAVIVLIAVADVPGPHQFRTTHEAMIGLQTRLTAR